MIIPQIEDSLTKSVWVGQNKPKLMNSPPKNTSAEEFGGQLMGKSDHLGRSEAEWPNQHQAVAEAGWPNRRQAVAEAKWPNRHQASAEAR